MKESISLGTGVQEVKNPSRQGSMAAIKGTLAGGAAKSSCLKPQNDCSLETSKPPHYSQWHTSSIKVKLPNPSQTATNWGSSVPQTYGGTSCSSLHSHANYLSWSMSCALAWPHINGAQQSFPARPPHPPIMLPLSRSLEGLTLVQCPPEVANSPSHLLRSPPCAE